MTRYRPNCSETSGIHEEGKRWFCHNYIGLEKVRKKEQYMNHCTQRHFERGSRDYEILVILAVYSIPLRP